MTSIVESLPQKNDSTAPSAHKMTVIERYRRHCEAEPSIPIFSRDWWLDAAAGYGKWHVALVEKGGHVAASMPYVSHSKAGMNVIGQPALTQTLGPWLRESTAKPGKKMAEEKDFLEELVAQLPPFAHFSQNWHHSRTNWLPFYWKGFQQTTRYTYLLPDLQDETALWDGLQGNIRSDIRKATGRCGVIVRDDLDIDSFLDINEKTFLRQGKTLPYPRELVRRLDAACLQRNRRKLLIAEDAEGNRHAGAYIVWDDHCAYYLMGGGDPEFRNSGATSLCLWEAIKFSATVVEQFDFEGSMLEPVERFFRAFGTVQTPYFRVSKTPSRMYRAVQAYRSFRRS